MSRIENMPPGAIPVNGTDAEVVNVIPTELPAAIQDHITAEEEFKYKRHSYAFSGLHLPHDHESNKNWFHFDKDHPFLRSIDFFYSLKPDSRTLLYFAIALVFMNGIAGAFIFLMWNYVGDDLLLGDSLVVGPSSHHDLRQYMETEAPIGTNIIDLGHPGYQVADLINLFESTYPVGSITRIRNTIVFWDSDVSNVNENLLNATQVAALRSTYQANVKKLIQLIQATGSRVAISGPGVLPNPFYGVDKTSMLNAYETMNQIVAKSAKIPYINVRTPLLNSIAAGINPTEDGEHLDSVGNTIVGNLFLEQFQSSLYWE